jgi:hypothetical protein
MTNHLIPLLIASLLVAGIAMAGEPPQPPDKEPIVGSMAVAKPGAEWDKDGRPTRLDFDFGDFKAWVRKKGGWQIEGWINHSGLVCGNYDVMVRFGAGNPGCKNVKWFSDPVAVTHREQCNSASLAHQGGDIEFPWADRFSQLTCAERIIRCTGHCRYTLGAKPKSAPLPQGGLGDRPTTPRLAPEN